MAPPLEIDIPSRRGRGRAANQLDLLERRADQLLFGLRSLGDPAEDGSPQGFNVSTVSHSPRGSASHRRPKCCFESHLESMEGYQALAHDCGPVLHTYPDTNVLLSCSSG